MHLIVKEIGRFAGKEPAFLATNISQFEREFETYDVHAVLAKELAFHPELVIMAIGDNVPALTSDRQKSGFKASLIKLLERVKGSGHPTIVVKTCFWPDAAKDAILVQACHDVGGVVVDGGQLSRREANLARSERAFSNAAVGGHPGDKGMQAIADSILEALRKTGP